MAKTYMNNRLDKYSSEIIEVDSSLFYCNIHKVYYVEFCDECMIKENDY